MLTITPTAVADILRKAADRIEERGWYHGAWLGPDGQRCAGQAIKEICLETAIGPPDHIGCAVCAQTLLNAVVTHLTRYLRWDSIPMWNDAPRRTASEVIDAIRACATWLEIDISRTVAPPPETQREYQPPEGLAWAMKDEIWQPTNKSEELFQRLMADLYPNPVDAAARAEFQLANT